jgi:hypothetical protein
MKAQIICRADGTLKAFRIDDIEMDAMSKGHLFPSASEEAHEVEIPMEHEHLFKRNAGIEVSRLKTMLAEFRSREKPK